MDVVEIEKRIDRVVAGAVAVSGDFGGIKFSSVVEMMEFAKLMAVSGVAVPAHCRGQPGVCLAIVTQAQEWRMSPYSVARQSYLANDNIAYQSQIIHAIVEARAPLKNRLRYEIVGEDDARRCKVWGTFKGEDKPHEYISETLGKLRAARGKNDRGQTKGSPLWETLPEVQLFYSASRQWARLFCPDVILGIYAVDELPDDQPGSGVSDFAQRLRDARARTVEDRGFNADNVSKHTASRSSIIEGDVNPDTPKEEDVNVDTEGSRDESADEGRGAGAASGADSSADQGGGADVRGDDREVGGGSAGHQAEATSQDEGGGTAKATKGRKR